jgi:large subunit ribosomal protein L25
VVEGEDGIGRRGTEMLTGSGISSVFIKGLECGTWFMVQLISMGSIERLVSTYSISFTTMSIARRLFTTTARQCNVAATSTTPAQLSAVDLPPTIYTIIARHIAISPPSSSYTIPNPFLKHESSVGASSSSTTPQHTPRAISRRREKQLLDHYSGFVLPPSDLNRLPETPSIRWVNGEEEVTVTWSGEVGEEQNKTLYGSRRRMFKGHKHERERPERERETRERQSGMEKRINDWRSVSHLHLVTEALADTSVSSRCQVSGSPIDSILVARCIAWILQLDPLLPDR